MVQSPDLEKLSAGSEQSRIQQYLPVSTWIGGLSPSGVLRDLSVGLLLTTLLIPQAMAYAFLADLPAEVGLLACLFPAIAYGLFGTSRFVAVGPVALVSLLAGEAIGQAASSSSLTPIQAALVLALMSGLMLVVAGLSGLGRVADFFGQPVLDGFATGAAVLIASTQVRHLFGFETDRASGLVARVSGWFENFSTFHLPTLILGGSCLILLFGLPPLLSRTMRALGLSDKSSQMIERLTPLLVIVGAGVATWSLGLVSGGVSTVGSVSVSAPSLTLPPWNTDAWSLLASSALVIACIIFVTGIAVAQSLSNKSSDVRPEQEMVALGAANVAASLTGGYPVGVSVSRSSVASNANAKTPLAAVFAGIMVLLGAWLLADAFNFLPKAALAALIISAAGSLIQIKRLKRTMTVSSRDAAVLVVTFLGVLLLGVDRGFLAGVLVSFAAQLWHLSRPRVAILGYLDELEENDERSEEADEESDQGGLGRQLRSTERTRVSQPVAEPVLALRIDEGLYFANARHVRETVIGKILENQDLQCLLLDFSSVEHFDATALAMLEELQNELEEANVIFALAGIKANVEAELRRVGFLDFIGQDYCFFEVEQAILTLKAQCEETPGER